MRSLLVLVVALGGCYLQYPALPKTRVIEPVAGATAEISRDSKVINADCGNSSSGDCDGQATHRARVVFGHPTYGGEKISHFQFKMLVDPEFRKKLAHIKDLKSTCNISIAPTVLAAAALGVALYIGSQKEENYSRNAGIAVGIGVGFYALSYPLGGYACTRARRELRETRMTRSPDATYVAIDTEEDEAYLKLLQELAAKFNANPGGESTPPGSETPHERPTTKPEPEPEVAPAEVVMPVSNKNVVETLRAAKKFSIFVRALDEAKVTKLLAAAGPFTVFAPSDEAFAKLSKAELDAWFADKKALAEELKGYVVTEELTSKLLETRSGNRYDTLRGRNRLFIRSGSNGFEVGDGLGTLPETRCTNGLVYAIDTVSKPSR